MLCSMWIFKSVFYWLSKVPSQASVVSVKPSQMSSTGSNIVSKASFTESSILKTHHQRAGHALVDTEIVLEDVVLSAFCFPELWLWLYHHVSLQIVVRGLDVSSAREAAVLDSQTMHVSPPSGGANMLLLCCQTRTQSWNTVKHVPIMQSWHNDTHVHTTV